jgi:hypothetical protein
VRRIPVNLVNVLLWYFYSLTGILSSEQNSFIPPELKKNKSIPFLD